jgi:hypothetical protein
MLRVFAGDEDDNAVNSGEINVPLNYSRDVTRYIL